MIMTSVRGSAEIPSSNLGIVKDLENYINYFEAHTYVQREISVNVWGKTDKTWEKKQKKKTDKIPPPLPNQFVFEKCY